MDFYINEQKYSFTSDELDDMYVSEGNEATIYRLGPKALKIYKRFSNKYRLNHETAAYLQKLSTNRILLPEELIYKPIKDEETNKYLKKFSGYTTLFKNSYSLKLLSKMPLTNFASEVNLISKDIDFLSENNISICDLTFDNTIYDGKINICDPGSYIIDYKHSKQFISILNKMNLNYYLCIELLGNIISLTKNQKEKLYDFIDSYYLTEELQNSLSSTKSVETYVKEIVK